MLDQKVTLEFSLNWLILIFLVGALLIGFFIFGPDRWHPALVFIAAILAGAGALTNAANGIHQRATQSAQAKVVAAMGYIDRWNAPAFYHCKKNGREVINTFKITTRTDDQLAYLKNNPEQQANLIDLLNQFESLNIAIKNKIADDETAKLFFRSVVIMYWHTTEKYIKSRRAERQNDRLFREFEALYERWKG